MNLIIDIGNSFTKVAVFSNSEIVEDFCFQKFIAGNLKGIISLYPLAQHCIISSVKQKDENLLNFLESTFQSTFNLDQNTKLPVKNLYKSKETLGKDRIAAAVGANFLFPGTNILVIDFGTAITFDIINSNNEYLGGNISPGLYMRFNALHNYTSKLPLLAPQNLPIIIGNDTKSSIISGVENGILFEVTGYINWLKDKYHDLKIIFTGGDAFFFDKKLKKPIFVDSKLTLKGLNRILEYNEQ